jgi:hypothetical protein
VHKWVGTLSIRHKNGMEVRKKRSRGQLPGGSGEPLNPQYLSPCAMLLHKRAVGRARGGGVAVAAVARHRRVAGPEREPYGGQQSCAAPTGARVPAGERFSAVG